MHITPKVPPPAKQEKVRARIGDRVRAVSQTTGFTVEGVFVERRRTNDKPVFIIRDDSNDEWKYFPWEVTPL